MMSALVAGLAGLCPAMTLFLTDAMHGRAYLWINRNRFGKVSRAANPARLTDEMRTLVVGPL